MLPPFASNDVNSRSTASRAPPSPINTAISDHRKKQKRFTTLHSHLSDMHALETGHSPRRDRGLSSFFAVKDKMMDPRKFLRYNLKYRQRARWLKWGILGTGILLLLLGYIPFFNFARTNPELQGTEPWPVSPASPPSSDSLFGDRDQFLLYRIIGNDLPPRHKEGQTLSNLHFILQHEPAFPNTRKLFVLNRIADPINEAAVIRLLERYHMEYIRIPFEEHVYETIDFRLEDFPEPDFLHSDDYRRYSKVSKLRALDYTYHDKNLYAMNNNGGRNTALEHARTIPRARWVMPFDGNCYLSQNGFQEIKTQLDRHGATTKYFVVPMTRLLNNSVLLNNLDERPKAQEEPQIIFRFDATEEYNLNMRYGRRSKLELLWRLGALENRRLNRPTVPWEPVERPYSKDRGNFRTIGWVFRLFSGNPLQEENKKEASSIRAFNRLLAIQSSLDSLDEAIARRTFRQERLFLYNETSMALMRHAYWSKDPSVTAIMDRLASHAAEILFAAHERLSPMAVADESDGDLDNPSQEKSNVLPDPLPIVTPQGGDLSQLSHNVTTLTLAYYFFGDEKYGRWAANLIRVYFLNEYAVEDRDEYSAARAVPDSSHVLDFLSDQGYSFPSLSRVPRVVPKYSKNRGLNMPDVTKADMTTLLDSTRLLRKMQALTHKEYLDLQSVMAEFLEYLVTSPTGIHLAQMNDHRGVLYDLQVTALAAFTNDVRLFLRVANRCRMRIGKQFRSDGSQPFQAALAKSRAPSQTEEAGKLSQVYYEGLNLQYWSMLARGIQNAGVAKDIWHYTPRAGGRISHALTTHLQKHGSQDDWYSQLALLSHLGYAAFLHSGQQTHDPHISADWQWIVQHHQRFVNPQLVDNATLIQLLT